MTVHPKNINIDDIVNDEVTRLDLTTELDVDAWDETFAIDVRWGSEWRENDVVGCAYLKNGDLFVKRGEEYRPAAILLGKACDGGVAESCTRLGYLFEEGLGVAKDDSRAAVYFRKGCNANDALSCLSLAILFKDGRGVKQDKARAMSLADKACNAGLSVACSFPRD